MGRGTEGHDAKPGQESAGAFGKYTPFAQLASGGMSDVFLAVERGAMGVQRLVVLKRLRALTSDQPGRGHLQMFLDEARLAVRLTHANIVHTYEVGEKGGAYFIAMEYLEGQPLNKIARAPEARATFTHAMWCRIVSRALAGLHYAHELKDYDGTPLGIVHRDASPHNIFVTYAGEVKIVDFGIAKAALNDSQTETGVLKGKVRYMSPEQALSAPVDRRSDIFSMGVVLWELLAGRKLFEGDTVKVLQSVINKPIPPLSSMVPGIPADLAAIVARATEREPSLRYQSAEEMHDALEAFIRRSGAAIADGGIGHAITEIFRELKEHVAGQVQAYMAKAGAPTSTGQVAALSLPPDSPLMLPEIGTGPSRPDARVQVLDSRHTGLRRVRRISNRWVAAGAITAALLSAGALSRSLLARRGSATHTASAMGAAPLAAVGSGSRGCKDGVIKVRILADLTGATASVCIPYTKGELDYLREQAEEGGLGGCKIEAATEDYAYDIGKAQAIYDSWKARPDWPDVAAIFGFGSGDTAKLAPQVKSDKKPLISASYSGTLATPDPIDLRVDVPEIDQAFREAAFPTRVTSEGYPYNFFAGTDYSTTARIAMFHVRTLGARRVGFFHCDQLYCTSPLAAARMYAKQQGLGLGRDLLLQLGEDQNTYEKKVLEYFEQEREHAKKDPKYAPVDWVWFGNTSKTTAYLAKAIEAVNAKLKMNVHVIVDPWGFDEMLFERCGKPCVDRVHGVTAFAAYGDGAGGATEMSKLVATHDKWRKIEAAQAGGGAQAYRNVHYVQGYVSAMIFRIAVERVLASGKPLNGETLKEALESFHGVDTGGLTDKLSFGPKDHRPQSTATIYKYDATGALVREPPQRTIALEATWLGW